MKGLIKIETKLIILRGNSGSGKTTIAKLLQKSLGEEILLVSQDIVRREMLMVPDLQGNMSIELIKRITEFGKGTCKVVILEGILKKQVYEELLLNLVDYFDYKVYAYYFDLPFTETVERHKLRSSAKEFGEVRLNTWWIPHDQLGINGEVMLTIDMSQQDIVDLILHQIKESSCS